MKFRFDVGDTVKAYRKETEVFCGFDFIATVTGRKNIDDPEYSLSPCHPDVFLYWEDELTLVPTSNQAISD